MSELKIQKPCENCELKDLLDDQEGVGWLVLKGIYMAEYEKNNLFACKHPWRLLHQAYNENPTPNQQEIISKVVEVRGKNPEDYNLPRVKRISTLDI